MHVAARTAVAGVRGGWAAGRPGRRGVWGAGRQLPSGPRGRRVFRALGGSEAIWCIRRQPNPRNGGARCLKVHENPPEHRRREPRPQTGARFARKGELRGPIKAPAPRPRRMEKGSGSKAGPPCCPDGGRRARPASGGQAEADSSKTARGATARKPPRSRRRWRREGCRTAWNRPAHGR